MSSAGNAIVLNISHLTCLKRKVDGFPKPMARYSCSSDIRDGACLNVMLSFMNETGFFRINYKCQFSDSESFIMQ